MKNKYGQTYKPAAVKVPGGVKFDRRPVQRIRRASPHLIAATKLPPPKKKP